MNFLQRTLRAYPRTLREGASGQESWPFQIFWQTVLGRAVIVIALGCILTPASLHAQQIRQPASVLPWKASKAGPRTTTIVDPTNTSQNAPPAWLLQTAKKPFKHSSAHKKLPMVESESFSHLGQIHAHSSSQRASTSKRINTAKILRRVDF